jgi:hypothetical protein
VKDEAKKASDAAKAPTTQPASLFTRFARLWENP